MCSSFFWKGHEGKSKGARVNWSIICTPKSEGGFGLRDSLVWNQACILQHIWSILIQAGSLWIAWIEAYELKGRSLWQVQSTQSSSWSWRKLLKMRNHALKFVTQQNGDLVWTLPGHKYSVAKVWDELRVKNAKVSWHRLIWYPFHIPKHSLVSWMAILNRLPTKDRLIKRGMNIEGSCVFCQDKQETRNHLFFECGFSKEIWGEILQLCQLHRQAGDWRTEFNWAATRLKGKAMISILVRLAWNAYIYMIWRERNNRLFRSLQSSKQGIIGSIREAIKIRLSSAKAVASDPVNIRLCAAWGITCPLTC